MKAHWYKSNYKTYHCIRSPYSRVSPLVVVVVSNDVHKIFQPGHQLVGRVTLTTSTCTFTGTFRASRLDNRYPQTRAIPYSRLCSLNDEELSLLHPVPEARRGLPALEYICDFGIKRSANDGAASPKRGLGPRFIEVVLKLCVGKDVF